MLANSKKKNFCRAEKLAAAGELEPRDNKTSWISPSVNK